MGKVQDLGRKLHKLIGEIQRYGVLLTPVSILLVYLGYKSQTYNTAWTAISSARQSTVDGGRREALTYLRENGRSLQGASLSHSLLSYVELKKADLNRSELINADLFAADLRDASLWGAHMKDANLQFAQLQGANLLYADLRCADLRGAHLEMLETGSTVSKTGSTILQNAKLQSAHLEGADLRGANMIGANLKHADLSLYKDRFTEHYLPSPEGETCNRHSTGLMDLVLENHRTEPSAKRICDWTREHPTPNQHIELPKSFSCPVSPENPAADLTDAILTDAILTDAILTDANLTNANLTGADLTGTKLARTKLTNANLTGAAGTTADQITSAAYLCNTILPDGTRSYRDCPKRGQK
jgi:uncharacterized protein YjbI with pentapeptide repeats